ncbi:MAG: TfoX/Sxy family protein [Paracoccaceae bacterium]|nr:TfoX/Sxy family protein [Paracoccaceae bacterium]
MATDPETMAFLLEQMAEAGEVRARRMFGEYAVYLHDKVVGFVCDDRLFLKRTPGALARVSRAVEGFPYPGAKPHLLIEDEIDAPEALAALLLAVADDLPAPRPKMPKRRKT